MIEINDVKLLPNIKIFYLLKKILKMVFIIFDVK